MYLAAPHALTPAPPMHAHSRTARTLAHCTHSRAPHALTHASTHTRAPHAHSRTAHAYITAFCLCSCAALKYGILVWIVYKNKVPTNRLIGLWEFYVMVISPIRTSRFTGRVLFFRECLCSALLPALCDTFFHKKLSEILWYTAETSCVPSCRRVHQET